MTIGIFRIGQDLKYFFHLVVADVSGQVVCRG